MYQLLSSRWDKILTAGLVLILALSLVNSFSHNSNTGVIGYDEGVYIVSAMGHYEDTPIEKPVGGLLDAVEIGMMRTGDPPGFFSMLHLWGKVSMSEQWLRILPFLFFCTGIIIIVFFTIINHY